MAHSTTTTASGSCGIHNNVVQIQLDWIQKPYNDTTYNIIIFFL